MENNKNIKKTNKALIVSNVILGCLLIIAMAFLAISIVNDNNVTANAAEENQYVKGELLYENTNNTPMTKVENNEDFNKYEFHYDGDYYQLGAYIVTLLVNGNEIEIPVFQQHPSVNITNENLQYCPFNLIASHDFSGYLDTSSRKFIIISHLENDYILKSIHSYPDGEVYVDYLVYVQEGIELKSVENLATNIELNLTKKEGIFSYYTGNFQLNDYYWDSYALLPPMIKLKTNNDSYELVTRPTWKIEENGSITTILSFDLAVAGLEIYYENGTITAVYEGDWPENFIIESLDIVTEKQANNGEELDAGSIIGNITSSFTGFLTGTGNGIVNLFETLYLNEDGGISIFAIVSLSMIGLGLAIGIIKILLARTNI